jgi:ribosomal protein S15P/S13E
MVDKKNHMSNLPLNIHNMKNHLMSVAADSIGLLVLLAMSSRGRRLVSS